MEPMHLSDRHRLLGLIGIAYWGSRKPWAHAAAFASDYRSTVRSSLQDGMQLHGDLVVVKKQMT